MRTSLRNARNVRFVARRKKRLKEGALMRAVRAASLCVIPSLNFLETSSHTRLMRSP